MSGFQPNFKIPSKVQNIDEISGFLPNFRILTKFNVFNQIYGFRPIFKLETQYPGSVVPLAMFTGCFAQILGDDCLCYKAFRKETEGENDSEEDNDDTDESCDETPIFPWTRDIQNKKRDQVYFDDDLPLHEHYEEYGCNLAKIKYPYSENIAQQFYNRMQGEGDIYNLPDQLLPDICENIKCSKHKNEFSAEATDLVLMSQNTVIYRTLSDKILDVPVYARRTKK